LLLRVKISSCQRSNATLSKKSYFLTLNFVYCCLRRI
jgi:hypothetical protein